MRAYALAGVALAVLGLGLFGLAGALDVSLLSDASAGLGRAGLGAALASFALLAGDAVLPVPASALMLLDGALFGPLAGALPSLAGAEAAALLGWAIGHRGGAPLRRAVRPAAAAGVDAFVRRDGALAIVLTRPVPVLAETAAIRYVGIVAARARSRSAARRAVPAGPRGPARAPS